MKKTSGHYYILASTLYISFVGCGFGGGFVSLSPSEESVSSAPSVAVTISKKISIESYWNALKIGWEQGAESSEEYLLVRREAQAVSWTPVEGTQYSENQIIENHTIVYVGSGISKSDLNLVNGTAYHYKLFQYTKGLKYSQSATAQGSPGLYHKTSLSGPAVGIARSESRIFVAKGSSGLEVIDYAIPTNPVVLGRYAFDGYANSVTVSGNFAYVSALSSGVMILDVSNPSKPTLVGSYNTAGVATSVAVQDGVAYIADGASGIVLLNVSNPANPVLLKALDTAGTASNIAISGSIAYVADGTAGLIVLDVSNPLNPTTIGSYDTSGDARNIKISANHAYLADGDSGLLIFNIRIP